MWVLSAMTFCFGETQSPQIDAVRLATGIDERLYTSVRMLEGGSRIIIYYHAAIRAAWVSRWLLVPQVLLP
jgi:hypothetical protein